MKAAIYSRFSTDRQTDSTGKRIAASPILFGWTLEQWTICFGRYPLKEASHAGALACKKTWSLNHAYQPGEVSIAGVDAMGNYADVYKLAEAPIQWMVA